MRVTDLLLLLISLLPLGACTPSLKRDINRLRTEIIQIEESIPPHSPLWIFEGPKRFDRFVDDNSTAVPDFIYLHIVRKIHEMSAADFDALSVGRLDPSAAKENPALFRGKVWEFGGLIADLRAEIIPDPKFPLKETHAGILFDDQDRPILFHLVNKPPVLTIDRDQVELRGLFVKMIRVRTKSGRIIVAPFLIGKVLRRFL